MKFILAVLAILAIPGVSMASTSLVITEYLGLIGFWIGIVSIIIFAFVYVLVSRKDKNFSSNYLSWGNNE